jgi:hypothetical protein
MKSRRRAATIIELLTDSRLELSNMWHRFLSAVFLFLLCGTVLIAADIKGKIIKVDPENRKITLTVEDKEQEFTVTKETHILGPKGDLKDGLKHKVFQNEKALKKGIPATLHIEKKGEQDIVTEIKLGGRKKQVQP